MERGTWGRQIAEFSNALAVLAEREPYAELREAIPIGFLVAAAVCLLSMAAQKRFRGEIDMGQALALGGIIGTVAGAFSLIPLTK